MKNVFSGTLFVLILRILNAGPLHGYAIGQRIASESNNRLKIEQGSLYPALRRMVARGWIKGGWRVSTTGRKIRAYTITEKGAKEMDKRSTDIVNFMQGVNTVFKNTC